MTMKSIFDEYGVALSFAKVLKFHSLQRIHSNACECQVTMKEIFSCHEDRSRLRFIFMAREYHRIIRTSLQVRIWWVA